MPWCTAGPAASAMTARGCFSSCPTSCTRPLEGLPVLGPGQLPGGITLTFGVGSGAGGAGPVPPTPLPDALMAARIWASAFPAGRGVCLAAHPAPKVSTAGTITYVQDVTTSGTEPLNTYRPR